MHANRLVPVLLATIVLPIFGADRARGQSVESDVALLTTSIEYLMDDYPEGPRALLYEFGAVQLSETAARALARRFATGILRADDLVTCTGAPRGCSLAGDHPAVIHAEVTERTEDSATAEVTLYQEFGGEVPYHFVRLRLSRSTGSWEIVEVLNEVIT